MAEEEAKEEARAEEGAGAAGAGEARAEAPEEGPKLSAGEIDKMNVTKLKAAALQYGGRIQGVHGMNKAQLVRALKEVNGIPPEQARRASDIDRTAIKQKIKTLKKDREGAIEAKDRVRLGRLRGRIKALRRKLVRTA